MKREAPVPGEPRAPLTCAEFERLVVFYACDELEPGERAAVEEHAQACASCAAALGHELRLEQAIRAAEQPAEQLDPSGSWLAQCRSELGEALDDQVARRARPAWLERFHLARWLALRPAWTAALLILFGVALGRVVSDWYRLHSVGSLGRPAMTVSASPRLSDQDLQTMGVAGINWTPDGGSGAPSVELHLTAEKPLVVKGNPDDTDIKRVLTFVVSNGQRFDPGIRLDSLEVLRTRSSDSEVRQALSIAASRDRNPGVRLKALEALRGFEQDTGVRQTLLDALLSDDNPGVRIEAINSLVGALRGPDEKTLSGQDEQLIRVLRDRMQRDPNTYVRIQCARAIGQIEPRRVY